LPKKQIQENERQINVTISMRNQASSSLLKPLQLNITVHIICGIPSSLVLNLVAESSNSSAKELKPTPSVQAKRGRPYYVQVYGLSHERLVFNNIDSIAFEAALTNNGKVTFFSSQKTFVELLVTLRNNSLDSVLTVTSSYLHGSSLEFPALF